MRKLQRPSGDAKTERQREEAAEYQEEIELFEKFELPVMVAEMAEYGSGDEFFAALNFLENKGYFGMRSYIGWTPVEIAHKLYQNPDTKFVAKFLFVNYRAEGIIANRREHEIHFESRRA